MEERTTTVALHGSEKRQRTKLVATRFTPAEKALLVEKAHDAKMDVGSFVRHQTLGTKGPRTRRRIAVDLAALGMLRGELGRVGNNLNQLTRLANIGDMDRPELLDQALAEILSVLTQVRSMSEWPGS